MKPAKQEYQHDPENGTIGDCFRACLASIFEVPVRRVPHFLALPQTEWWLALLDWLAERNVTIYEIRLEKGQLFPAHLQCCDTVLSGNTERNDLVRHAVVGKGLTVVHDPHPDRAGLKEIKSVWVFAVLSIAFERCEQARKEVSE